MKKSRLSSMGLGLAIILTGLLFGGIAVGQEKEKIKEQSSGFCSENWSSDNKESFRELREMTMAAGGVLDVDAGKNGGIRVSGENRADVLVRACVQAWGTTVDAAKAAVSSVKVTTAGGVRAEGPEESNYSVSFEILVPRSTDVRLKAHNGGISISNVEGNLEFDTVNGGVHLDNVGGEVKGRTTNGGVNVALSGNSWKGSGLDVQTSNGGVHISMPENYAANIETGTVNGGFSSDIAALNVEKDDRGRARTKTISASLNGGGAPIHITTTNGGVRISSARN
ncbi:MAG TPA: DUF4097 family beta strand repeat-containing protein [Pyrinomonadaceae bacterium]|nr:DUF4097 family beta strand repeat-containing protein [Pyrinomonadaceae bacterium]